MIGYGANKGIVPQATKEIFDEIKRKTSENIMYQVSFSMLEIYNERIQDLLISVGRRPTGGLAIREDPKSGFYVKGLSERPVDSYEMIEELMTKGNYNRTTAATQMNESSSRAHTVISINLK